MRLPLIAGIAIIILSILIDAYIYMRVRKGASRTWSKTYLCSAFLTVALTITLVCWPKRNSETSLLPAMWMLFTWLSIYIPKIIYIIFSLFDYIPLLWKGKRKPIGLWVGLPVAVIVFCTVWYGSIWGRRNIDIEEITISSERLPASFKGYKIVQFSDAHVGTWGNDTTFIHEIVEKINALNPDIIVFTGDIVNRKTDEIKPFINVLSRLKAKQGVYSIMGNHDYGNYANWPSEAAHEQNTAELRTIEKSMGWHLLDNSHVTLRMGNDSIKLIGVENWGEPPFNTLGDIKKATDGVNPEMFAILLSHNPMHWRMQVRDSYNIDLTLAGHTHAMQMRFRTPWKDYSLSSLKYPEWEGLTEYQRKDDFVSRLYVNIGCGEVGFPARIGANPEITLITLQ
ncbi:MAG: metallophosphoesterase [Bacteroidales bacterium]|nr:metallophosphoesterase [Bacteroidales bacterium]